MNILGQLRLVFLALLKNKQKFILTTISAIVFVFLLFPFDDLGDLVSTQVGALTNVDVATQGMAQLRHQLPTRIRMAGAIGQRAAPRNIRAQLAKQSGQASVAVPTMVNR